MGQEAFFASMPARWRRTAQKMVVVSTITAPPKFRAAQLRKTQRAAREAEFLLWVELATTCISCRSSETEASFWVATTWTRWSAKTSLPHCASPAMAVKTTASGRPDFFSISFGIGAPQSRVSRVASMALDRKDNILLAGYVQDPAATRNNYFAVLRVRNDDTIFRDGFDP